MGGDGSLFLKIGGSGLFLLKNGWEWVAFVEKWVGVGESGWERNSVKPVNQKKIKNSRKEYVM